MHRAILLLFGLLLALAAAVVLLTGTPAAPASPGSQAASSVQAPADAERAVDSAQPSGPGLVMQASLSALRVQPGTIVAGLFAAGGVACIVAWRLARGAAHVEHGRSTRKPQTRSAPNDPAAARSSSLEQALPLARSDFATQLSLAVRSDSTTSSNLRQLSAARLPTNHPTGQLAPEADGLATKPVADWLRSDAGDNRASAALCAVDDVLASGGWRSRVSSAASRPDTQTSEVRIGLALHPAERNIASAVADRVAATHPAWQATAAGNQIVIRIAEQAPGLDALLLPVLQTEDDGPWTQYLYAPSALGLTITGPGASDVLHGMLADLTCMYPPTHLAITVLGEQAQLYRAAPQWAEPPDMLPATIERLAQTLGHAQSGAAFRPLLLAAIEPDETLARALAVLERCLGTLRTPPVALVVAAERPGTQLRALAALPALAVRSDAVRSTAELRVLQRRTTGRAPYFAADDIGELLRWLPRFGASLPPCIWDTIASSAP